MSSTLADGTRFRAAIPIELSAAASQAAEVKGYLALLRAVRRRARAAPSDRRESLRGLIAPELGVESFDAVMDAAELRERQLPRASRLKRSLLLRRSRSRGASWNDPDAASRPAARRCAPTGRASDWKRSAPRRSPTPSWWRCCCAPAARGASALSLAAELLVRHGGLQGLARAAERDVRAATGVGPAKSAALAAAVEIGRRLAARRLRAGLAIRGPADVYRHFHPTLRARPARALPGGAARRTASGAASRAGVAGDADGQPGPPARGLPPGAARGRGGR